MKARVNVTSILVASTLVASVLFTQVAISAEAAPPSFPENTASSMSAAPVEPESFVSDGSPYQDMEIGLTIYPPAGWEVQKKSLGMSLILQEPKQDTAKLEEGKTVYQRNITVLTLHDAVPIDEKEASNLKEKLAKDFGGAPGVQDFRVLDEHKFFDFKGKNDGLIVYTTFKSGETPMAQMHVMISGAKNRFLMTYTDMASEFEKNEGAFQTAWKSMSTVDVNGEAPVRYEEYKEYGVIGGACLLALVLLLVVRRKKNQYALDAEEDFDISVQSGEGSHVSQISPRRERKRAKKASSLSELAPLSDVGSFNEVDFPDDDAFSHVSSLG